MMSSQRGKEPLDNVIERVMAIAQRVVGAENVIKNQSAEIAKLKDQVVELKEANDKLVNRLDNIALKASGQEFKKPTTRKTTTTKTTDSWASFITHLVSLRSNHTRRKLSKAIVHELKPVREAVVPDVNSQEDKVGNK